MLFNNVPVSYDMMSYGNNPNSYFASQTNRISVEYTGSSTLDDRDRRRQRISLSKDKENIPNMHLVRALAYHNQYFWKLTYLLSGAEHKIEHPSARSGSGKRST